jgi:hypothetical protein
MPLHAKLLLVPLGELVKLAPVIVIADPKVNSYSAVSAVLPETLVNVTPGVN